MNLSGWKRKALTFTRIKIDCSAVETVLFLFQAARRQNPASRPARSQAFCYL